MISIFFPTKDVTLSPVFPTFVSEPSHFDLSRFLLPQVVCLPYVAGGPDFLMIFHAEADRCAFLYPCFSGSLLSSLSS